MKKHTWYYNQLVTENDMNEQTQWTLDAEKNLARDIDEYGVFSGFQIEPDNKNSEPGVLVHSGVARDRASGSRMELQISQHVDCIQDEYGASTYNDLQTGEGRWCSLYIRPKVLNSDPRIDGHNVEIFFTQTESLEFFIRISNKCPIGDKWNIPRPGLMPTAVLLADIWIENGSVLIDPEDIDLTRREDYYRATVAGVNIVAGSPKVALQQIGNALSESMNDLADPDLPTGANDGAHKVGLGGHATQAEWKWQGGRPLNASGNTVHDVVQKIVSDLGDLETQGVPGSQLVSAGATTETWADGQPVDPGSYDGSVGGFLNGIVRDLASAQGGKHIGATGVSGSPYSLSNSTLQSHDEELLVAINDHVTISGHPVNAISHPETSTMFADGRKLFANQGNNRWDQLVNILGEKPVGIGTAGDQALGCGPITVTRPDSPIPETLSLPGNVSQAKRNKDLLYEILGRVRYNGDDRLEGVFTPADDLGASLGAPTKRFDKIYVKYGAFTENIYIISQPSPTKRYINACGGFSTSPTAAQPVYAIGGEYLYNSTSTPYNVYACLDFLKPGDRLYSITMDWWPNGSTSYMLARLYCQRFGVGPINTVGVIYPSATSRHTTEQVLDIVIADGYQYWVWVYTSSVSIQRLYGALVQYYINSFPY